MVIDPKALDLLEQRQDTRRARYVWRTLLLNQALAVPIALLEVATGQPWLVSLMLATTFAQCIGFTCYVATVTVYNRLPALSAGRERLVISVLYFCAGVVGSLAARAILAWTIGLTMSGSGTLFSLAIGASIAVLVGLLLTTVRQLRATVAARERELRDREMVEERLLRAKSDAEVAALQARINPHFLFNTLNSIAALIHDDPGRAEQVTWQLSSLFRYALEANERRAVTLEEELTIVRKYLEIEHARFGHRLTYDVHVDPALLTCEVPVLSLQPLVENAIRHGIALSVEGGRVEVRGWQDNGQVVLAVINTGGGRASAGTGEGLENVRQRLAALYGRRASVTLDVSPSRTEARLSLPADTSADDDLARAAHRR